MIKNSEYYLSCERIENGKKIVRIPKRDLATFETRAPYLYRILSDDEIKPFIINDAQRILHLAVEEEFTRSKAIYGLEHCQLVNLKSRQVGGTTYAAMRNMDFALYKRNLLILVTSHVEADKGFIFEKYQICFEHLPDYLDILDDKGKVMVEKYPFKPTLENDSGSQLKFYAIDEQGKRIYSDIQVRTAGSGDNLGKGFSASCYHGSECANYDSYAKVLSSVKQTMKTKSFKFVILESTANGTSGQGEGFYNTWITNTNYWSKFQKGDSHTFEGYRPVFVPWYALKTYRKNLVDGKLVSIDDIHFDSPEQRQELLDREKILMEQYGVPIEGINWYRDTIISDCENKYSYAMRYYPTFAEDAFLATNNCFFDTGKLFAIKASYDSGARDDNYMRGYLNEDLEFTPHGNGELTIRELPDPTYLNRYIIGLDQSEGLEAGDYTSMKVFDRLTQNFVAHWYGKLAEDQVAIEYMKLGYYYNDAYLIPETNRATVINIIKPDGIIPYSGEIYIRSFTGGEPVYGWNTNGATRKEMLDELYAHHRDTNYETIYDLETCDEYLSFVRKISRTGISKYQADTGKKDDIVMSDALCIVGNNRYDEQIIQLNVDRNDIEGLIAAPVFSKNKFKRKLSKVGF